MGVLATTRRIDISVSRDKHKPSTSTMADSAAAQTQSSGSPSDFLRNVVGQRVILRLNSGVDYTGILSCLDGYMNAALEETQEVVNGKVTNSFGDAFVRGNNILYITKVQ